MWVYNASPAVNAASQYKVILGVCLSLTVLMVMTVGMRLVIRARNSRLAAADYVMVVGMVSIDGEEIPILKCADVDPDFQYNIQRVVYRTYVLLLTSDFNIADRRRESVWTWVAAQAATGR